MGKRARRGAAEQRLQRLQLGAHGTGDEDGPIGEAWMLDGPLAALAALYRADTPEELQRVLLIPGRRVDTDCLDAALAFRRAYDDDRTGLVAPQLRRWVATHRQHMPVNDRREPPAHTPTEAHASRGEPSCSQGPSRRCSADRLRTQRTSRG